jgi:chromodomain-helicase-DNA-binding protein 7
VASLQNALKPYMLRRKKCDVEQSIAAKEETIVEVELTRVQKLCDRMLIDHKSEDLIAGQSYVKIRALNNLAIQLWKVCNHPFLLPDVEQRSSSQLGLSRSEDLSVREARLRCQTAR